MFNRIKNILSLSRLPKSSLTPEHIELLKEELRKENMLKGDGKAEFIGEGSTSDYEEQEKKDQGMWGLFGGRK